MTRVETVLSSPNPEATRRRWRLPRIHFGFIVVIAIVIGIAYGLGRIGFVRVPFVPVAEPRRVVESSGTSATITDLLAPVPSDPASLSLSFTETEVTSWLRQQSGSPLRSLQATIEPADIEIFGYLNIRPSMAVTAYLEPVIDDGAVRFRVRSLRLGTISLPTWMNGLLLGPLVSTFLPRLMDISHTNTELAFGKLLLTPNPAK